MKIIKRIAAICCTFTMAMGICSLSACATDWGLYHSQGAPASDTRYYQEIFFTPKYNGLLKGYCSSYSVSTGNVRATAYRLMAGSDGHIYAIQIDYKDITNTGSCNISNSIISTSIYCEVDLNFTSGSSAYGSAYGYYK